MPRALISVYDKTGVVELARGLAELGWEVVASGGTASHLLEHGVGVETTGVTVHLVDEGLDTGPVIVQEAVPVEPRETLVERIHAVEHRLLPRVVEELACLAR